jgi:hypothetical protein
MVTQLPMVLLQPSAIMWVKAEGLMFYGDWWPMCCHGMC